MTDTASRTRLVRTAALGGGIPAQARVAERRPSCSSNTPRAKTTAVASLGQKALTVEEWQTYGTRLGAMSKSTNWWLGDWVRFGLHHLNRRYDEICRVTGYDEQTPMNMAYVAKKLPVSRRREKLSWRHPAELAALSPDEQDCWLDLAVAQKLSVRQLRTKVRVAQRVSQSPDLEESSTEDSGRQASLEAAELFSCPHCGVSFTLDELRLSSG